MQVRKANSRQMQVFQEEELYNATPASLVDTLPETVPIEQVIKKAPGKQGHVWSQANSKVTTGL